MPDEQDRAEALDDDKLDGEPLGDEDPGPGIDVIDQTADADPAVADIGREAIDELETGDDLDGVLGEGDNSPDPGHVEPAAPEVAAMHVTEEP